MDVSEVVTTGKILRKVNPDGSVTFKRKKDSKRKVVIARGKGEHTVGAVITSSLLPFKKSMVRQLNSRGYNASHIAFKNLIPLYYNEFVSNPGDETSRFTPLNAYEFRNNPAFKINPSDNYNGELSSVHQNHFVFLGGIVDNIIDIYKVAKLKKRQAILNGINPKDVLTDEELAQAKAAEKVEKDLENKALDSKAFKQGTFKNIIVVALVVLLFYFILR